jgi:hypothetical protein
VAFAWHHLLTNTIIATDINARLQGFGRVLAVDGVGALDAVGEYQLEMSMTHLVY